MSVQQCPHCEMEGIDRFFIKDTACNYVICGRGASGFVVGHGCGRPFCFQCGLRLCGRVYDEKTGRALDLNEDHNHVPGSRQHAECNGPGFCQGGHNSHKN